MHPTPKWRFAEAPCLQLQNRMLGVPNFNGISIDSCEQSAIDAYTTTHLIMQTKLPFSWIHWQSPWYLRHCIRALIIIVKVRGPFSYWHLHRLCIASWARCAFLLVFMQKYDAQNAWKMRSSINLMSRCYFNISSTVPAFLLLGKCRFWSWNRASSNRIVSLGVKGMPGLGSRLSTYWPTKKAQIGCSQHTSPIPWVPVASPGFKPKGRVCTYSGVLEPDKLNLAWAAKPLNAATPGLGPSVC